MKKYIYIESKYEIINALDDILRNNFGMPKYIQFDNLKKHINNMPACRNEEATVFDRLILKVLNIYKSNSCSMKSGLGNKAQEDAITDEIIFDEMISIIDEIINQRSSFCDESNNSVVRKDNGLLSNLFKDKKHKLGNLVNLKALIEEWNLKLDIFEYFAEKTQLEQKIDFCSIEMKRLLELADKNDIQNDRIHNKYNDLYNQRELYANRMERINAVIKENKSVAEMLSQNHLEEIIEKKTLGLKEYSALAKATSERCKKAYEDTNLKIELYDNYKTKLKNATQSNMNKSNIVLDPFELAMQEKQMKNIQNQQADSLPSQNSVIEENEFGENPKNKQ